MAVTTITNPTSSLTVGTKRGVYRFLRCVTGSWYSCPRYSGGGLVPLVPMNVFCRRIHHTLDELQTALDTWLKEYNEVRPHSGKCCFGKTPVQTFLDTLPLLRERMLNRIV
jgi:hypothetical protein